MSDSVMSFFILASTIFSSVILFQALFFGKKSLALSLIFCLLLVLQFSTTKGESLTSLNNDQIRIRDQRLSEYPPVAIKIGNKTLWLPVAHWFENRPEFRALSRITQNFAQVIDPNFYFFANHPRERVGFVETPKFSFVFLPFFLWGGLSFFKKSGKRIIAYSVVAPIVLISLIGLNNSYGAFSLTPFIAAAIILGIFEARKKVLNYGAKIKK